MYLFLDTETNGLPKNNEASYKDTDNWPRIVQLAWQVFNAEGRVYKSFCSMITPNGWTIPDDPFFITNKLTTDRCIKEGMPLEKALQSFVLELEKCRYFIAHNADFDKPVVQSEMFRLGMKCENRPITFCTMNGTKDILQLPGQNGFKRPSLKELHHFCFQRDFDGAHDAGSDVTAMANCFFDLRRKGLVSLY